MVSTIDSQQEGAGFDSPSEAFLCGVHVLPAFARVH